ncbi:MAG: 50S ribosomal protein L23 [Bdellovibrionales bacterium]|nr:50S ribosomal protein L23 [Bdellovibrionales bacterium]
MKKKAEKKPSRLRDFAVLDRPILTEKSSVVGASGSTFVFRVDPRATKTDIREAIERLFEVNVESVRTCNYLGKLKRTMRSVGRRSSFKKAYVTLQEGQSISVVEGL